MLIDTHCHLDAAEFSTDRPEVALSAGKAGIGTMVIPAVERSNWERVREVAHSTAGACYALGIHPMYVARASERDLEFLAEAIASAMHDPRFVAVGEIGLDFFDPEACKLEARQHHFFQSQLELARHFELPVVLHVRRSQDQILKQLRKAGLPGGIAHAFNGSDQQASQFIALGFKLGMGGAMTYHRSTQIRRHAQHGPLHALVLETDAPDIAPSWIRGQRNTPAELKGIARELAHLRGISIEEVEAVTTQNACDALPRLTAVVGGLNDERATGRAC
jgi:TatD DNase family protein